MHAHTGKQDNGVNSPCWLRVRVRLRLRLRLRVRVKARDQHRDNLRAVSRLRVSIVSAQQAVRVGSQCARVIRLLAPYQVQWLRYPRLIVRISTNAVMTLIRLSSRSQEGADLVFVFCCHFSGLTSFHL